MGGKEEGMLRNSAHKKGRDRGNRGHGFYGPSATAGAGRYSNYDLVIFMLSKNPE